MSVFPHPLLAVQHLDITLGQIRHRLATLPERAAVESADAVLVSIEAERAAIEAGRAATRRDEKRLEDELATLEERITRLDRTLYGGGITSPKDAMLAQDELESLKARRSDLEDRIIALLDELEPSDTVLAALVDRRGAVESERAVALAALDDREVAVGGERDVVAAERAAVAATIDAAALSDYERLRVELAPATVVTFDGSRCVGCPSVMPAVERDRMRRVAAGSVAHCGECDRVVIR